jgi:hypothetical protein
MMTITTPSWPPTSEGLGHDQLTNAAACAWFGAFEGPGRLSRCSPWMSLRADMYRQRAAQAKQSAPRAKESVDKERIRRSGVWLARTCRANGVD